MVTITTTLEKFLEFVKNLQNGTVNTRAYEQIAGTLKDTLRNQIFGDYSHTRVFEIPTQTDLEVLIMAGGRSHKPSQPREAHYSEEYLEKKKSMNLPAHEYKNKGFVQGTEVIRETDRVLIRTPSDKTTARGYNYGPIHESKKSVLKMTFLSSWTRIMENIINSYVDELT
jgi:hypothetical protein